MRYVPCHYRGSMPFYFNGAPIFANYDDCEASVRNYMARHMESLVRGLDSVGVRRLWDLTPESFRAAFAGPSPLPAA